MAAYNKQLVLFSFGFKYGPPGDAALVLDLRFLPNPYWVEELRPGTGLDPLVAAYVLKSPAGVELVDHLQSLILFLVGACAGSDKVLRVALGCTGGRHRSVAVSARLAALLSAAGVDCRLSHRDIHRDDGPTGPSPP